MNDIKVTISLIIALCGLFFGLYQYYINQKWKRSEVAAKMLEKLYNSPYLNLCCKFLDWKERKFPLPEEYKILFDTGEGEYFLHSWNILKPALRIYHPGDNFNPIEILYRDLFDHFFDYLEQIEHHLEIKLYTLKDISPLGYYLKALNDCHFCLDKQFFSKYLKAYGYEGVIKLKDRFK